MSTLCITFCVLCSVRGARKKTADHVTLSSSPLLQDIILAGGSQGYPLSPAHTDFRDTEIATSAEATLDYFYRQNVPVDPSRSVW